METVIIGVGSLTVHEVAKAIEKSPSFETIQTRWKSFANHLGVNSSDLPGLERKINLSTLQLSEVPRELLHIWKAEKGRDSTLKALCDALNESDLKDIAETLAAKFYPVEAEKRVEFIFQEIVYTLEELLQNKVPQHVVQAIKSHRQTDSSGGPIQLIRREVHPLNPPVYYIPRTLSCRNELDTKIFTADATKEHIFLVKGIQKLQMARACQFKPIKSSGNQLEKVTVQHILLEHDDDFHTICRTTGKPVHMIEFKNKSFFHLKSNAGMGEVEAFIKENSVTFGEMETVKRIEELQSPFALSISDSPGMGKTFVLAKLYELIEKKNPKAIILFIVLQELAKNLNPPESDSASLKAIATYATSHELAGIIFQEMLMSDKCQLFLFLDGYDEVTQNKLDVVDPLIHHLINVQNIKIIVTTRPHQKTRLENILQRRSFEILPFEESNQIEFLTKYWNNIHASRKGDMLETFARKCLRSLKMHMIDKDKDIAGIPLQCYMLAEVYAKQAIRAADLKSLPEDVVRITSFFEMYTHKTEIQKNRKFARIKKKLF